MGVIIADTSILILFAKIESMHVLKSLFKDVFVTPEVAQEFGVLPNWVNIKSVQDSLKYHKLQIGLGLGEASAIVLALELKNSILLIDERKGRKIAKKNGVKIVGSLGVLLLAKKKGHIANVKTYIDLILGTNFRISERIIEIVLQEAGEGNNS